MLTEDAPGGNPGLWNTVAIEPGRTHCGTYNVLPEALWLTLCLATVDLDMFLSTSLLVIGV